MKTTTAMNDNDRPSRYEQRAIREIRAWKNVQPGFWGKLVKTAFWPIDKIGDTAIKTPGIGWVVEKSVAGIVSVANDVAQWTIRPDAIYQEFRDKGYSDIYKGNDILQLDLEDIDKVIGWLAAKYKVIAAAEGGLTGVIGLPGIPIDIAALITYNLRAIGEYAVYCGFDNTTQHERMYAMNVLCLASSPDDAAKTVAMAQLIKIAREVAKKKAWKDLEKHAFVKIIQHLSKALGIRLTKAKLAQAVPLSGAVIGAGFNAYYTTKVCNEAYHCYRERFLAAKYGEDIIEITVKPADDFEPGYEPDLNDM